VAFQLGGIANGKGCTKPSIPSRECRGRPSAPFAVDRRGWRGFLWQERLAGRTVHSVRSAPTNPTKHSPPGSFGRACIILARPKAGGKGSQRPRGDSS
jgi:hypothetical protein